MGSSTPTTSRTSSPRSSRVTARNGAGNPVFLISPPFVDRPACLLRAGRRRLGREYSMKMGDGAPLAPGTGGGAELSTRLSEVDKSRLQDPLAACPTRGSFYTWSTGRVSAAG